jgi:hypothetical protein
MTSPVGAILRRSIITSGAREGLQSPGAAEAYRNYLKVRAKSANDPLAADAKKRLRSLQ